MRSRKIIFITVVILLLGSISTTQAYTPEGEGFVAGLVIANVDDVSNVHINEEIEFKIIVKNLWNDTIHNITITQAIPENVNFVSVADQPVTDNELTITSVGPIKDTTKNNEFTLSYLNVTESNFTTNLDMNLNPGKSFSIGFSVNITESGSFTFEEPQIDYYDHWGDKYDAQLGQDTTLQVEEPFVDTRTKFIPQFTSTAPDYTIILGAFLGILVLAVLSRMLHVKKPFEL